MPILVLIASTLLFWGIYWFVRMGGVDRLRERSARRKDEARRAKARESEQTAPLRAIDDPREAATVLMLLIPRGSDPTAKQIATVEAAMRDIFGFDHDLSERLAHARFIASRAQSFAQAAGIFSTLFRKQLTEAERGELVEMVEKVAQIDGPSDNQTAAIQSLEQLLGLVPPMSGPFYNP
jgi:uncharacterized tellurite resistance protein B-like protein